MKDALLEKVDSYLSKLKEANPGGDKTTPENKDKVKDRSPLGIKELIDSSAWGTSFGKSTSYGRAGSDQTGSGKVDYADLAKATGDNGRKSIILSVSKDLNSKKSIAAGRTYLFINPEYIKDAARRVPTGNGSETQIVNTGVSPMVRNINIIDLFTPKIKAAMEANKIRDITYLEIENGVVKSAKYRKLTDKADADDTPVTDIPAIFRASEGAILATSNDHFLRAVNNNVATFLNNINGYILNIG